MSRGTPFQSFRLPPELKAEMEQTIARRNDWSIQEPWTLSSFIVAAINEKLDKMARSRGKPRERMSRQEQRKLADALAGIRAELHHLAAAEQ